MKFPYFLQQLQEAATKIGESLRKDRAKASATDLKTKDAARKRAERARQIPRDRKPKQELVKEVIAVKTRDGILQLIFKDSFNPDIHEKVGKDSISLEEAQQISRDPKFEQTRASKLLLGDVRGKEEKEGKKETKKEGSKEAAGEEKKSSETEEKKESRPKAKRLSKEEIFKAMSQMDGNQLAQMPLDVRQEYFKATRKPPTNTDFDNMSYEALTVKFAISPVSNLPYNQQVLNALMFLAKMKAGASEQEMQTYNALAPTATEFTRNAFNTAKKILSQMGEQCIQNLISTVETGNTPVNSEGSVDMECGKYKFKVSAGGEMALSTTQFDQGNKSFKGLIASALMQTLSNPQTLQADPRIGQMLQSATEQASQFSTMLIPNELLNMIKTDETLASELKNIKLKNAAGQDIGPILDENGNLNPLASLEKLKETWLQTTKGMFKGGKGSGNSPLRAAIVSNVLKANLRGDGLVPPEMAPNHLVTINGVFPLSDDYFNIIAQQADVDIKPAKDVISSSNIGSMKSRSAETMKKYRTIVEEKQQQKKSLKDFLVNSKDIDPIQLIVQNVVDNNDFLMNASLLPGFSPKDLNAVEYNYVTIGKKTIKIPVVTNERVANQMVQESAIMINDCLIEALTNNFVLQALRNSELLNDSEQALFETNPTMLLESVEDVTPLKEIYKSILERIELNPSILEAFILQLEEAERDYKKEYKNYHGKPKQRKERAARTAARELMIKKGRVKRGDGKDIDHKKPLRNGGSKGINNLRVRDKSSNRSDNGHKEGETQKKGSWK
jgi:hypothetical protein